MFDNITIGQYFPGDTFIHKLDPRTKIFLVLAIIIMAFVLTDFASYFVLTLFFIITTLNAKLSFLRLLKSIKPLYPIIIITLLVHMFSTPGEVIYKISVFNMTKEGILQGLLMVVRLIFLLLFSSIITMTTSPLELTDGLEKILNPFKKIGLPAHELAMMMTIALRFIPTLLLETQRIMMAQKARGADFQSGSIIKKAKNLLSLVVPLFLSAFRRADELAIAMESRCYRGGEGRTRMYELSFAARDTYAVFIVSLVFLLMFLAKGYKL